MYSILKYFYYTYLNKKTALSDCFLF
jgi:hypothetical protein